MEDERNDEHPAAGCGSVVPRVAVDWKMRGLKSIQIPAMTRVDPTVLVIPEFLLLQSQEEEL